MIKATLSNILEAVPVFKELAQSSFRGVASFQIAKLIRELDKELKTFDAIREKMIEEYAERDENGKIVNNGNGTIRIQEGLIEDYNNQMCKTLEIECEINADKISMDYFEDIEMTPIQSMAIINFVE